VLGEMRRASAWTCARTGKSGHHVAFDFGSEISKRPFNRIAANFDALALTVDTITGGNRERDLRTGFTSPPHRSIILLVRPLSLWKYNWKSFGVLIEEPISSMLIVRREEMPNMVPNFSAALATALSPS
jgi:hypothetical protein